MKPKRKYKPVDRSTQGAAQSGAPNIPLGPIPPFGTSGYEIRDRAAEDFMEESAVGLNNPVDTTHPKVVELTQSPTLITASAQSRKDTMILTLKGYNAHNTAAFYEGARAVIRFQLSTFPGKTAPQMIEVADGVFELPKAKKIRIAKVKLTKEERAAQRAAAPKPTAAERIARAEARLAALRKAAEADEAGL